MKVEQTPAEIAEQGAAEAQAKQRERRSKLKTAVAVAGMVGASIVAGLGLSQNRAELSAGGNHELSTGTDHPATASSHGVENGAAKLDANKATVTISSEQRGATHEEQRGATREEQRGATREEQRGATSENENGVNLVENIEGSLSEQAALIDFNEAIENSDYSNMVRMPGEIIILDSDEEGITFIGNPVVFTQESGDQYAIYFTPGESDGDATQLHAKLYKENNVGGFPQSYTSWVTDAGGERLVLPVEKENDYGPPTGAVNHVQNYAGLSEFLHGVADRYDGAEVGGV